MVGDCQPWVFIATRPKWNQPFTCGVFLSDLFDKQNDFVVFNHTDPARKSGLHHASFGFRFGDCVLPTYYAACLTRKSKLGKPCIYSESTPGVAPIRMQERNCSVLFFLKILVSFRQAVPMTSFQTATKQIKECIPVFVWAHVFCLAKRLEIFVQIFPESFRQTNTHIRHDVIQD